MGFRLHRSMKLLPGVRLNFSKSGLGLSLGAAGARMSINPKYGARATMGIPGTGLSYSQKMGGTKQHNARPAPTESTPETPSVTCPHCHKMQRVPTDCDHNTTLSCAFCKGQFTPPVNLFVDDEEMEGSTPETTPREVHLVLHSVFGNKQIDNDDPTDAALDDYLEQLTIGDGSRLALVAKNGFVQAFRSGADMYRVEWRNAKGNNSYVSGQADVTAVHLFQHFANGNNMTREAEWKKFDG